MVDLDQRARGLVRTMQAAGTSFAGNMRGSLAEMYLWSRELQPHEYR